MADLKQAVEWMKEGKKVRRESTRNKHWNLMFSKEDGKKDFLVYSHMKDPDYDLWKPSLDFIDATDWEIYKEKPKSLSDEIRTVNQVNVCDVGAIQRATKKLYDYINSGKWSLDNDGAMCLNLLNKIKDIFGEKLV